MRSVLLIVRDVLAKHGLHPPNIVVDGRIHRFSTNGRRSDKAGFYAFWDHGNGFIAGFFGDWRSGLRKKYCSKARHETDPEAWKRARKQIKEAKEQLERERKQAQESAVREAKRILAEARDATADNPYLKKKKVRPCNGLKQDGRTLLVPVMDINGEIHSLQKINPDGGKYFLEGGHTTGCFFRISGSRDIICIGEGLGTALTINQATGCEVFCAFYAGNLKAVARTVREKYPGAEIVICADNDQWTDGNPGVTAATEAARAINGKVAIPQFKDTSSKPTDFNDLHILEGIEKVKQQLMTAKNPKPDLNSLSGKDDEKKTQAQILLELCGGAKFFHTPELQTFSIVSVGNHKEVWPVRSPGFKRWLSKEFYGNEKRAPNAQALSDALNVLEGKAQFDSPQARVFVRIGCSDDKETIYLDLANDRWQVVEITKTGWRIIDNSPVYFRRTKGMLQLPYPKENVDIALLRGILNIEADEDWILIVSWLVQALNPLGPYPILALHGEQGSGKSFASRVLRSIVDPSTVSLRTVPRNEHELVIAAKNSWALTYDNLSGLPGWLSDALCRLSTGGGMGARQLYTDDEETLFDATRPQILNGITEIVTRHDLADRTLFITLPPIQERKRAPEAALRKKVEEITPYVLGGLLNAVSCALRGWDKVQLDSLPRLADFALWVTAAEPVLPWGAGDFLRAYTANRREVVRKSVEADFLADTLLTWFEDRPLWSGSASELLCELDSFADEHVKKEKSWPKNPVWLGRKLRRVSSFLRQLGIRLAFPKGEKREIKIERIANLPSLPSLPSEPCNSNKLDNDSKQTVNDGNGFTGGNTVSREFALRADPDSKDSKDNKMHTLSMSNANDEGEIVLGEVSA